MGLFGFVATLYLFGRVVQHGVTSAIAQRKPDDAVIALAAVAYVVMFLIFAFVDIAWGIRPLLTLGLCFAICADYATVGRSQTDESRPTTPDPSVQLPSRATQGSTSGPTVLPTEAHRRSRNIPRRGDRKPTEHKMRDAIAMYESGASIRQVGRFLGVSATTARRRLIEAGIELRKRHGPR
jgi:hypothetical protein